MAIETLYESTAYRLDFDTLYGTSWFVRKKDDAVAPMNTGTDAIEEKKWAEELGQENKHHITIFNEIASEHEYSPRWSKGNGTQAR